MILRFVSGSEAGTSQIEGVLEEFPVYHQAFSRGVTARIRYYQPADRPAIRQLCCDTGFLGNSVEKLFRDRELFADLFTNAYLDYAPEWALVAEVDGRVVGYLLGAVSKNFDFLLMRSGFRTASKMFYRLATGRYSDHPHSKRFVRWLFTAGLREQPKHPSNAAHLHWDIDRDYRGRGICHRFWNVYENRLRQAGVTECYGAFFSHSRRRPETIYARYGFSVFDRKPTTLFEPFQLGPVDVVCVRKRLPSSLQH